MQARSSRVFAGALVVARRLGRAAVVLLGAATIMFVILRLSGDPAALMLPPQASDADRQALALQFGLDKSLSEQYGIYISKLVSGDFGMSFRSHYPAIELVQERLGYTLMLAAGALSLIIVVSMPLGIVAARYAGSPLDRGITFFCIAGQSVPVFVTGSLLILLFAVQLQWLPSSGAGGVQSLILPVVAVALYSQSRTTRLVRAGMVSALQQDYIRTARAKGLGEGRILVVHALRNVVIPVVTMLGLEAGGLLGRAVIVEVVFAWPGLGRLIVDSVLARDYAVAQAGIMTLAALYTLINILVDLTYVRLDPRLRDGRP